MQTTATRTAGSHTDLLTGILNVQVRNEDKITEQDLSSIASYSRTSSTGHLTVSTDGMTSSRKKRNGIGKSRASSMRITVRSPYGISISTTAGRMTIPTTNSNRLTSSTSLRTTTAMPTRISRVASFPISTGPTM